MLGAMTKWFGLTPRIKEQINREVNILDAINAHVHWKARLLNYRNGLSEENLEPERVCRDDLCELGKWMHGAAKHVFFGYDEFMELREKHAHFHAVAGKVVQHVQEQNFAAADKLLANEYSRASREVVQALTGFSQHLH
jgi:hypothetical protein